MTTAIEARPEEVFRVAGPSVWPFWTSVGMAMMTVMLVFSQYALAAASLVGTLIALALWHRDYDDLADPHAERAFEATFGVPLRPAGSRAVLRWSTVLTCITLGTAWLTLAFSYLYLRLRPPQWPPMGLPAPDPIIPAVGIGLLLASAFAVRAAARGVDHDQAGALRGGLLLAIILGAAYIAVTVLSFFGVGFDHSSQAFGSIFWTMAAFQMLVAGVGVAALAITLFWFWRVSNRGEFGRPNRQQSVPNLAVYWYYVVGAGVLTYALLYLGPLVI